MVVGAAAAAAGAAAASGCTLFEYNRHNFFYDRRLRQETEYQIMDFRIRQAELWREDVRDIIGLTSVKMDTYLIVNAVQLGFCVMAFCEGRLATGTPTWLVGCHTLSLAGAFMYLLMSVWFSMHASITAKGYEVRLLTQLVRLPIPSWTEIEAARTYGSSFEKVDPRQMFRVPFVMGTQEGTLDRGLGRERAPRTAAAGSGEAGAGSSSSSQLPQPRGAPAARSADPWGLEGQGTRLYELDTTIRTEPELLRHLQLVKEAIQYWQSYDGYARVAMSVGTNQLVNSLSFYVIGYVLISCKAVIAAWLTVMLFMVVAAALIRLDISLTTVEFYLSVVLAACGPTIAAFTAEQWHHKDHHIVNVLSPVPYFTETLWLIFLLNVSKAGGSSGSLLPTGFRSVMYIDVFGWIQRGVMEKRARLLEVQAAAREAQADIAPPPPQTGLPGNGPAVQSVRYDGLTRPVPIRPENLPGASGITAQAFDSMLSGQVLSQEVRRSLAPETFVPRTRQSLNIPSQSIDEAARPGLVPWRIFCAATTLLVVLWCLSGCFLIASTFGYTGLQVFPLAIHAGQSSPVTGAEWNAGVSTTGGFTTSFTTSVAGDLTTGVSTGVTTTLGPSPANLLQADFQSALKLESLSSPFLQEGSWLVTNWPHLDVWPHAMACEETGTHEVQFAAATRFSLFAAKFHTLKGHMSFQEVDNCGDLDGESLLDLSLDCLSKEKFNHTHRAGCAAVVLHQQGLSLASCKLPGFPKEPAGGSGLPSSSSLSQSWLLSGSTGQQGSQEEVRRLTLAKACWSSTSPQGRCAYSQTNGHRIVELEAGEEETGSEVTWFPTRVLEMGQGSFDHTSGSTVRLVGDRFLGVFEPREQRLRLIDPKDLSSRTEWPLPDSHRWLAMCSTQKSLYLLADGSSPQILKWDLPTEPATEKAVPAHEIRRSKPLVPPSRPRSLRKLLQMGASVHAHLGPDA